MVRAAASAGLRVGLETRQIGGCEPLRRLLGQAQALGGLERSLIVLGDERLELLRDGRVAVRVHASGLVGETRLSEALRQTGAGLEGLGLSAGERSGCGGACGFAAGGGERGRVCFCLGALKRLAQVALGQSRLAEHPFEVSGSASSGARRRRARRRAPRRRQAPSRLAADSLA